MRRILISLMTVALVGALISGGIYAYFSDTETSTGNTFTAGTMDLYLTGGTQAGDSVTATWTTPSDWAPGDTATGTLTMDNVGSIDMTKVKLSVAVTDSGVSINEPECVAEGGAWTSTGPGTGSCSGNAADDAISENIDITTLTYAGNNVLTAAFLTAYDTDTDGTIQLDEFNAVADYDLETLDDGVLTGDGSGGDTDDLIMTVQLQSGVTHEHQSDESTITLTIVGEQ